MRKMREQIQRMSLAQHGQPRKVALNGSPDDLPIWLLGSGAQSYYFTAPVSEILHVALASTDRASVYVTGVALELDLFHTCAVDFFALCLPMAAANGMPEMELDSKGCLFALGTGIKAENSEQRVPPVLCGPTDPLVAGISRVAFSGIARDGTLFNAPLRNGSFLRGQFTLNGKSKASHTGRASASLSRKGEMTASMVDNYVRDSIRVWWDINKVVKVFGVDADVSASHYSVLCGVRPQVELPLGQKNQKGGYLSVGNLKNVRVTVHYRQ